VVEHPQVVIADGRIVAVGKAGDAVPDGARRIDLGHRTLLPGLIDMHVHLTADPTLGGYRGLEFTDNFWTVVGTANALKTLRAGFTTVRNVGSAFYDDVAIKQAIEGGYVRGPRIVPATTYAIGATGGHTTAPNFRHRCRSPARAWPTARRPSAPPCASCANTVPKSSSSAAPAACCPRPIPSAASNTAWRK
jgi:imidazolonepropionase-like amidohydrolase